MNMDDGTVVDPTNDNNAIDKRGRLVHALRLIDVADPNHPTVEELSATGTIIGYGTITGKSRAYDGDDGLIGGGDE
jgi:hypothetical protein